MRTSNDNMRESTINSDDMECNNSESNYILMILNES